MLRGVSYPSFCSPVLVSIKAHIPQILVSTGRAPLSVCPRVTRRPRSRPLATATSNPSPIILDHTVHVPSSLPSDRTRTVPVTIKAENLGGRRRRVSGSISIQSTVPRVWTVLTSYAKIDTYMPNILESRIEERSGVIYLDQVGIISRKLALKSRMLVRVSEHLSTRTITFTKVRGKDFAEFVGRYSLTPGDNMVSLEYELIALPFPLFPVSMVERKIIKEVPKMLAAVRQEAILGTNIPIPEEMKA